MDPRSYSYLDVSALDGVREKLAAGEAALVVPGGLDEVIWANGPAAILFGHATIASFVGGDPEFSAAARRQIAATPGFPNIGAGRTIAVRLAKGVSSQTVMFSASIIALPDGEQAILLSVPDALADTRGEEARAARAISGLAPDGGGVAVVDASGAVLAASEGFDELGIGAETLAALATEVAGEADRMVKRPIATPKGELPAGIVRLADDPAVSLLMIANDGGREDEAPDEEPASAAAVPGSAANDDSIQSHDEEQDAAPAAAAHPEEIAAVAGDDVPVSGAADCEPETGDRSDEAAGSHDRPDDGWYFNGRDAESAGETTESDDASEQARSEDAKGTEPASEIMGAALDHAAAPLRFVWRTDADGRFSALSDEFRYAVGPEASDIVGRDFAEVAETFGLDPDNEIAGLMKRRDTWSGRSVLWPIAGTDLVAPVDLAALPVYGRDGTFEGFRGFGIARMGDAVVDEEARGLLLTGEQPLEAETEAEGETIAAPDDFAGEGEDPFQGEVPALALGGTQERRESDKVIRLAERRSQQQQPKGLSSSEQQNFQEIGKRLKEAGDEDDTTVAGEDDADPATASSDGVDARQEDDRPAAGTETETAETSADEDSASASEPAVSTDDEASTDFLDDPEAQTSEDGAADLLVEAAEDVVGNAEVSETKTADDGTDETGEVAGAEDGADALTAEAETQEDAPADSVEDDGQTAEPEASDAAADDGPDEGHTETAAAEDNPAPGREAGERRAPVGLSAFLPSAFAGGLPGDAALGIDSAVLSRLPLPLLIHSGDELHYANREFMNLTGYRSLAEFDLAGGMGAIFADPYAADGASDQKLRLRTRDGAEFPVNAFLQSVGWQGGKALLLALRRADQTDVAPDAAMKDLETRLAELRTIIDTATDGVIIIDNEGAIRSVSRPAEALFGYDGDDVTGRPFTSLFAIESQRPAREYLDGLAGNGVASVLNDGREVIGRESQGRFIPLFMTIGRLPNDSGFCAVLRDITHWKRAEEELTEARAAAERASSQKTEFLARVSHEIRTPLNAIIGFSELMVDEKFGPIGSDRYRDYLRDINRSGNHVLDLVNDLLDISKIEAGQQELSYEAVSLNDVLGEAVAMMQPQANRERVIIRSSFASNLPDVVADLRSIRQIALNLLSNAIRYTPAGGQVIVSTAYESSGDIAVRVRDTGVGMAAADIEQALKPFKQINAMKRPRGDGTGLGLPLTKAMVEANRARFVIQSTPGEGTLVEIVFPSQRVLAD
ncbi:MAG: PAS domain S-box protein [Rhizobiaceae bacterium]